MFSSILCPSLGINSLPLQPLPLPHTIPCTTSTKHIHHASAACRLGQQHERRKRTPPHSFALVPGRTENREPHIRFSFFIIKRRVRVVPLPLGSTVLYIHMYSVVTFTNESINIESCTSLCKRWGVRPTPPGPRPPGCAPASMIQAKCCWNVTSKLIICDFALKIPHD